MTDARSAWPAVRQQIERSIGADAFANFFKLIEFEGVSDDGRLLLSAPTGFLATWTERHYAPEVLRAFRDEGVSAVLLQVCQRSARKIEKPAVEEPPAPPEPEPAPESLQPIEPRPPVSPKLPILDVALVQKIVARFYGIEWRDILGSSRRMHFVRPRQLAMLVTRIVWPTRSLPDIGRRFGGKDHTTVLHAVRKWSARYENDDAVRDEVDELLALVRAVAAGEVGLQDVQRRDEPPAPPPRAYAGAV